MFTILIILLPILYQIKSPVTVISLGELIIIPFAIYELCKALHSKNYLIKFPNGLELFYIFPIFITFISACTWDGFNFAHSLTVISRIVFYLLIIILSQKAFNYNKGVCIYYYICIVVSIYFFMQITMYYVFNIMLPIPRNYSEILFSYSESFDIASYYHLFGFRPASIFTEPSFYADYISPLICFLLFDVGKDNIIGKMNAGKRLVLAMYFSVSIVLSTSNLGCVYLIIIWTCFLLKSGYVSRKNHIFKIIVVFVAISFVGFIITSDIFTFFINRLSSGGSTGPRVIRGFLIYSQLPLINEIFGVGLNNVSDSVKYFNIETIYDQTDLGYTVSMTNRLITTGIIGFTCLLLFVIKQIIRFKKDAQRVLVIILIASLIFEAGEYSHFFAVLFVWIISNGYGRKIYEKT